MLQRSINTLQYPASNTKSINEFLMRLNDGEATLGTGLTIPTFAGHCHLLKDYHFDKMTRIVSFNAGVQWIERNEVFLNTLKNVIVINFNGAYENDLICHLVQKCSTVSAMSFTYFKSSSFVTVLQSITSTKIMEITAHVSGTNTSPVETFDALAELGKRVGCKLGHLMLFFNAGFNGTDIAFYTHQTIKSCLDHGANVMLLYNGEIQGFCMNDLLSFGYQAAGKITVAVNGKDVDDVYDDLLFECYYLFQKDIDGISYIIGCKKNLVFPDDISLSHLDITDDIVEIVSYSDKIIVGKLDIRHPEQQHQAPAITHDRLAHFDQAADREYPPLRYDTHNADPCCNPAINHNNQYGNRQFCEPAWDNTRVVRLVYLQRATHFVFSNGLIFQLCSMGMEKAFLMKMRAAKRMTFVCTTQIRKWIEAYGLLEFLSDVCHAEFAGFWFDIPFTNIIQRLPAHTCTTLSMMRMKMDRKPSVFILRYLRTRTAFTKYFYDCRDTFESSLASVMNGIVYHPDNPFSGLESVFIMARSLSCTLFQTSLPNFFANMSACTKPGAEITIVVHETLSDSLLPNSVNLKYKGEVFIPGIFSSRLDSYEWCGIMRHFSCFYNEKTWNVIMPH